VTSAASTVVAIGSIRERVPLTRGSEGMLVTLSAILQRTPASSGTNRAPRRAGGGAAAGCGRPADRP
jgi:hypothetical protein